MKFCHLRTRTEYSVLNSTCTIDNIAEFCKNNESFAIGIMDDMSLSAGLAFSQEMISGQIKPIIGVNIYIYKDLYNNYSNNFQLPYIGLIAKNVNGYKKLLRLLYKSFDYPEYSGFRYIHLEDLRIADNDLICLTGGYHGLLVSEHKHFGEDKMQETLTTLNDIFKNNLYIEITRHGNENENKYEESLIAAAYQHNIPLVATNNVYFYQKKHSESFDVLSCIKDKKTIYDSDRFIVNSNHYLKSEQEMLELFSDIPEAIENTVEIAKRCNFAISKRKAILPSFAANDKSETELLLSNAEHGLLNRFEFLDSINYQYDKEIYRNRLKYEIDVINKMGFCGYFLIVADFVAWAKNNNISVGPGRGSGAGSIVAWSLNITDIDPIRYNLLFERFLNPDRVSMPDFDIDFCQEKREQVINYVKNKYGVDKVAYIATYGKLQAKAVIKDVGRALGILYLKIDEISKLIPFNPLEPITLEKAINMDPQLQKEIIFDIEMKKLIEISIDLEGLYRHISKHAAGIIIADENLLDIVPLIKDSDSNIAIVAYDMKDAEKIGLMKFDFLGLKTLTVISGAASLIKQHRNINLDISKIPLDDSKTFELLGSGYLRGIFQFEAAIPRITLEKIKISKFEDLAVVTSLARPGPMEFINTYIKRKLGEEVIEYYHPLLNKLLEETSGIIIYQEQVMEIAKILAGYSLAEADLLRRAMGKKIQEEMDKQKNIFISKAKIHGVIDEKKAETIFNVLSKFAGYGFNKSHATSYSMISYQAAYLKAHYTIEFFVSMLNLDIDNTDRINELIIDIKRCNISVVLPNINLSSTLFILHKNTIIYALSAIKGIGTEIANEICDIRNQRQNLRFTDFEDFLLSCGHLMNKKVLEGLIKSGALGDFNYNIKTLISNLDYFVNKLTELREKDHTKTPSIMNLFGQDNNATKIDNIVIANNEYANDEKLNLEFEALGFFLSQYPIANIDILYENNFINSFKLEQLDCKNETTVLMFGVIVKVIQRYRKKKRFAFVHLIDTHGTYEVTIFNDELITNNRLLLIEGKCVVLALAAKENQEVGKRLNVLWLTSIDDFMTNTDAVVNKLKSYNFKKTNKPREKVLDKSDDYSIKSDDIPSTLRYDKVPAPIERIIVNNSNELQSIIKKISTKDNTAEKVILVFGDSEIICNLND